MSKLSECEKGYRRWIAPKATPPDPKWRNVPTTKRQAERAVEGKLCLVCGSPLLLPIIRPPIDVWKVHCNHCGTEMPIAVLLNRKAWKV